MKRPTTSLLILGFFLLTAGDCPRGSPSDPGDVALTAAFTGIFTPVQIASDGRCKLTLETSSFGGDPFEANESSTAYSNDWRIPWRDEATDLRGYPEADTVRMELPDGFGPGSFPIDLTIRDETGKRVTAEANPLLNCESATQLNFTGS